ncbi:MAG TPA: PASTA domain-containing protein [Blastocatellia bacterium]|nr:PASTA domain-containing protein [Blastocatellia bacterium]
MSSRRVKSKVEASSIAWTISRRLGMVIILALAFFLSATITIYTLFRIGDTQVPDVIGRPQAEAQQMAEEAGLKVSVLPRADEKAPANTVFKTDPAPNSSVKKDSVVKIYVSTGPPQNKSEFNNQKLETAAREAHHRP